MAAVMSTDGATIVERAQRVRLASEELRAETHARLDAMGWNTRRLRRTLTRSNELQTRIHLAPLAWNTVTRELDDVVVLLPAPNDAS